MTIEKLEQYYGMSSSIEAINEQIRALYSPVRSPSESSPSGSEPGDPTKRSAMKIIRLKESLNEELDRMYELAEEIETWLVTVTDLEVVAIIRWHYLLRLSWKQTNMKVYGKADYDYSRKKIKRYFEKLSELSE